MNFRDKTLLFHSIIKDYCNYHNLGLYCGFEIVKFSNDINKWDIAVTVYDAQGDPLKRKFIDFVDMTKWVNEGSDKNCDIWNEFISG